MSCALVATVISIALASAHADEAEPLACRVEVNQINDALRTQRAPTLCPSCAERLEQALASLYGEGRLPRFYQSAGTVAWNDPQSRPLLLIGKSLAGMDAGLDLAADIDSGYGPRGSLRLLYTRHNEPIAVATDDRRVFLPVIYCSGSSTP
ncbi:hypothetical protein D7S89_22375 [Trinickia fusca]|uniref:Uncharacterized protein n=2 Tax=Trinickia fusca TaxID=2419777 RepID=A0A494X1L4_9BURK|nr:hypothetical protein D7S89_22375 [Trinickia fusca]